MITFDVQDMTCNHCVAALTRAVKSADPRAAVTVDLPGHRVVIEPEQGDAKAFAQSISDAGYTPVLVGS